MEIFPKPRDTHFLREAILIKSSIKIDKSEQVPERRQHTLSNMVSRVPMISVQASIGDMIRALVPWEYRCF